MEPARGRNLLMHRRQEELPIRSIEAGGEKVGALAGIEVDHRFTGKHHVALDLCGTEPRNEPCHRMDQGRLAAPGTSDEPHRLPRADGEIEVAKDRSRLPTETNRQPADLEAARAHGTQGRNRHHLD